MTILGIALINQIRTGGDRRYLELLETLAQRGNKVFVIMNSYLDYKPNYITKIEIPVKYVRHRFPPASYLFKKSVKKHFDNIISSAGGKLNIDFIHIHGDIYLKSAIYIKKKINKPLFYASRNNDIDRAKVVRSGGELSFSKYMLSLFTSFIERHREKQIAKYAELITFQYPSDRDSSISRTKASADKTVIITGNIGEPRCTPEWKNKNKSESLSKIVCVGATSITKGFVILLRVLKCLKERGFNNLHVSLLGRFTDDKLVKLIEKYNLTDMISLEGFVDPFPFLASHDLLLYPILFDAYPDAVLEALHAGCPVIASYAGGLPDMLHYPEILFNQKNIEQIADRIQLCITDPNFYKLIRELCAKRVDIHVFDWESQFEKAMSDYLKNNA